MTLRIHLYSILVVAVVWGSNTNAATWSSFNHPLGTNGTWLWGIEGNRIVGHYADAAGEEHGFIYDGSFTAINVPGAKWTHPFALSGGNIVGVYLDTSSKQHGFLYDGSTYITVDHPSLASPFSGAVGINGDNVVGYYRDSSRQHGYIYNILTSVYTTIDVPSSRHTATNAIHGSNIVGYTSRHHYFGFLECGRYSQ